MNASYLRNAWYQVAWSSEVGDEGGLARTVLDTPLFVFRDEHKHAVALFDRCPHRFAPLSKGTAVGSTVTCGYHGLVFDTQGQCVRNPHGPIPPRLQVQAFPVLERHDALWVWMGEANRADPVALPDFGFIDATPASAKFHGLMPTAAPYQLVTDNLMDLSHIAFLHPTTFGDILQNSKMEVQEQGDRVQVDWKASGVEPPDTSPYRAFVPIGQADIWAGVEWMPPALLVINSGAVPAGQPPQPTDRIYALHSLTPETATTTHYFYCVTRAFKTDDVQITALMKQGAEAAFLGEDKPMIEAQFSRMGTPDLFAMKPMLLSVDAGAGRSRRKLDRLILAESESATGFQKPGDLPCAS